MNDPIREMSLRLMTSYVRDRVAAMDAAPLHAWTLRLAARLMFHDGVVTRARVDALPPDTLFAYLDAADDLRRLTERASA